MGEDQDDFWDFFSFADDVWEQVAYRAQEDEEMEERADILLRRKARVSKRGALR